MAKPALRKECERCHRTKHHSEFMNDKREADGLATVCVPCSWEIKNEEAAAQSSTLAERASVHIKTMIQDQNGRVSEYEAIRAKGGEPLVCKVCNKVKDELTDFYPNQGNICKICHTNKQNQRISDIDVLILTPRKGAWDDHDKAKLATLWTEGATMKDICLALQRRHGQVSGMVSKLQKEGVIHSRYQTQAQRAKHKDSPNRIEQAIQRDSANWLEQAIRSDITKTGEQAIPSESPDTIERPTLMEIFTKQAHLPDSPKSLERPKAQDSPINLEAPTTAESPIKPEQPNQDDSTVVAEEPNISESTKSEEGTIEAGSTISAEYLLEQNELFAQILQNQIRANKLMLRLLNRKSPLERLVGWIIKR